MIAVYVSMIHSQFAPHSSSPAVPTNPMLIATLFTIAVIMVLKFFSLWCQEEQNPLQDPARYEEKRGTSIEEVLFDIKPNKAGKEEQRHLHMVSG